MSDIDWTPVMVERKILEISNRISKGVIACDERYKAFLAADLEYDRAYAQAFLDYDGPQGEKRYAADVATVTQRSARDVADAAYRFADRLSKSLSAELDAYRSLGASVRQAYATAGTGER